MFLFTARWLLFTSALVGSVQSATYSNPLKAMDGGDPNIVYENGYYHLMSTYNKEPVLVMSRATTLDGLKTAEQKTIYREMQDVTSRGYNLWAPEMHKVGGVWHIYYAAGPQACCDDQNAYVLKGGANLWDDAFQFLGKARDDWSIDMTLLTVNGQDYVVYSGHPDDKERKGVLRIARRSGAMPVGESRMLSSPTESWEMLASNGGPGEGVNEGPYALYHDGKTYITYSASHCTQTTYALGLLTYNGGDPMDASSWSKIGPVFKSANGNNAPGHNSFFTSPDGSETWNVYHSTTSNGDCGSNRQVNALKMEWNEDGSPNFGEPSPNGEVLPGPGGE